MMYFANKRNSFYFKKMKALSLVTLHGMNELVLGTAAAVGLKSAPTHQTDTNTNDIKTSNLNRSEHILSFSTKSS